MVFPPVKSRPSAIPQQSDHLAERGIAAFAAPADQAPELDVAVAEQGLESGEALALEQRRVGMQEPLEHQLVLEQAAAAAPAQTVHLDVRHVREIRGPTTFFTGPPSPTKALGKTWSVPGFHTDRFTISSLILPIARVGLRFFGQESTQFMMV